MSNAGQLETKTDKMHERSILLLCLTNNLGQMWTKAQKGVFYRTQVYLGSGLWVRASRGRSSKLRSSSASTTTTSLGQLMHFLGMEITLQNTPTQCVLPTLSSINLHIYGNPVSIIKKLNLMYLIFLTLW